MLVIAHYHMPVPKVFRPGCSATHLTLVSFKPISPVFTFFPVREPATLNELKH